MDNKKIPTILGTVLIIIFSATALAFVLVYENKRRANEVKSYSVKVVENNQPESKTEIKSAEQASEEAKTSFEEDLKSYPPMDPKEATRLTNLTKDWKTFKDEEKGYEFKYPSDYSVQIMDPGMHSYIKIVSNGRCMYDTDMSGKNKGPCSFILRRGSEYNSEQIIEIKNNHRKGDQNIKIFSFDNKMFFINTDSNTFTDIVHVSDKNFTYHPFSFSFPPSPQRSEFRLVFQGIYFTLKSIN
ncbi:MAG: hypothetical protein ACD_15C00111G0011 [uncultured bacterium]|nr:MAG: hypothetical protein ACD_15C00111G0011 [uncultured bacterium]